MNNTETGLSEAELHERLLDYASYMLASARALEREPASYGPMRMFDALEKVLNLLLTLGIKDEAVSQAIAVVREHRPQAMTDPERFAAALDQAILGLVAVTLRETGDGNH